MRKHYVVVQVRVAGNFETGENRNEGKGFRRWGEDLQPKWSGRSRRMIDYRLILNEFDETARRLQRKGVEPETLGELRDLLDRRRKVSGQLDDARGVLNKSSEHIGRLSRE